MSMHVNEFIERMNGLGQGDIRDDPDMRVRLLQACQALSMRLESPWEFIQRIIWQEVRGLNFIPKIP